MCNPIRLLPRSGVLTVPTVLLLAAAASAQTGLPRGDSITRPTTAEVSLDVVPDGSGDPLTAAQLFGGQTVDATVTIRLVDIDDFPIAVFPFQDLWLTGESATGSACSGPGFPADANTDANGETTFGLPPRGGGLVNMIDLVAFAADYHGPYAYRSDFLWDGNIDLSDVARFAADLSKSCP